MGFLSLGEEMFWAQGLFSSPVRVERLYKRLPFSPDTLLHDTNTPEKTLSLTHTHTCPATATKPSPSRRCRMEHFHLPCQPPPLLHTFCGLHVVTSCHGQSQVLPVQGNGDLEAEGLLPIAPFPS